MVHFDDPGTIEDYIKGLVAQGIDVATTIRPGEEIILDAISVIPVKKYSLIGKMLILGKG